VHLNETETAEEQASVVLPPDSSDLFRSRDLSAHNFAESSFTEDQVGTDVSEFDLENADTSSVTNMQGMFVSCQSFNQDIGGWCVEQINFKPSNFDESAGFEGDDAKQPNWGEPC
jgi:Mycoplasma protein of unknown function, DUF285.